MTALNILQTYQSVVFVSDGAFIDPRNGHLVSTGPKVVSFPHARCAVGVSGPVVLLEQLTNIGNRALTIDQVRGDVEALLPKILEILLSDQPRHAFEIYIGGFSPEGERQLWRFAGFTDQREFSAIRCDADAWRYSPKLTPTLVEAALGKEGLVDFERGFVERLECSDPVAHGLLAIEAQRRSKTSDSGLACGSAHTVGVFAQVTTVTFDKIESQILKRWPDVGHRPITPEGSVKVYEFSFGEVPFTPAQAVGFKSANGIDAVNSSSYDLDTGVGKVSPSASYAEQSATTTGAQSSANGFTFFDRSWAIDNGETIAQIGVFSNVAGTFKTKIGLENSTTSYDVVVSEGPFSHTGSGWEFFPVSSPYTVPGTGTYRAGFYFSSGGMTSGTSVTTRSFKSGDITGAGQTGFSVTVGGMMSTGVKGVLENMTLVTTAQTADASVDHARVVLMYNPIDAVTLNTDLTVEVSCDGGSNWFMGTLTKFTDRIGIGAAQYKGADTQDVPCTAGTSFVARVKTLNNKNVDLHGLTLTVR